MFGPRFVIQIRERAGCLTLIVFIVLCGSYCYVSLPYGAVDWSMVCDCCIFWPHSIIFSIAVV